VTKTNEDRPWDRPYGRISSDRSGGDGDTVGCSVDPFEWRPLITKTCAPVSQVAPRRQTAGGTIVSSPSKVLFFSTFFFIFSLAQSMCRCGGHVQIRWPAPLCLAFGAAVFFFVQRATNEERFCRDNPNAPPSPLAVAKPQFHRRGRPIIIIMLLIVIITYIIKAKEGLRKHSWLKMANRSPASWMNHNETNPASIERGKDSPSMNTPSRILTLTYFYTRTDELDRGKEVDDDCDAN
jgi:hypothetical protein